MDNGQVLLADDHLAVIFDYDADAVAQIKQIAGAKWDRLARVWRVPIASLQQVQEFGKEHGMWISPDVEYLELPERNADHGGVRYDTEWVWLGFPYDPVIVRAVKHIPGITWDPKSKA